MPVLSLALSWESTSSRTRACVPLLTTFYLTLDWHLHDGLLFHELAQSLLISMQAFILCTTPWLSTAPGSLFISILPQGSFLSQRRFRGSLGDKSALQSIPLVGETIFRKLFSPYLKKKKRKQLSLVTVFGISLYLTHVPCYGKRAITTEGLQPSVTCPGVWRSWC